MRTQDWVRKQQLRQDLDRMLTDLTAARGFVDGFWRTPLDRKVPIS